MLAGSIKSPVLLDRLEILPEFGPVPEPAYKILKARDGNHGNSVTLLDLLDRGRPPCTALHPIQGDYHSGWSRAVRRDHRKGLAHGGARRQHVVYDQHAARKRCADEPAAFSVILHLLAIEGEGHVASFAREGHGRPRGKDDAFVGGTEQHVELHA